MSICRDFAHVVAEWQEFSSCFSLIKVLAYAAKPTVLFGFEDRSV